MELNGFMIGPEIKTLFKIKVGAVIAEHPVLCACYQTEEGKETLDTLYLYGSKRYCVQFVCLWDCQKFIHVDARADARVDARGP